MSKVSVVIPCFNAEKYLKECLLSVRAQTLQDIEIICVDDGSTDTSLEILTQMAKEDPRLIVVHQNNAGAGAARNHGIRLAKGKYFSFLDADDFFAPQMLEAAYAKAEAEQAEMVVFKADFCSEKTGELTPCNYGLRENMLPKHRPFSGTEIEKDTFKVMVGWAWDKLFLADFVRNNHLQFQEQRTTNDMLFVFSALAKSERISTVPAILAHHRRAAGTLSVTREKSWMCFYSALLALREQLKTWGLYNHFEQDYINYALHFSLWNLNTLKNPEKEKLYAKLRSEWFKELGITEYPQEKFYHRGEFGQYKLIMKFPYNKTRSCVTAFAQRGLTWLMRKIPFRKASS